MGMDRVFLVGLDAGGGSGRCLVVEVNSGEVHAARREWSHPSAPGTLGLGYDLDLDLVWKKLGEATREALEKAGARPGEVAGIAATSMRNTTVLLDGSGKVLMAVPNQDARALGESMSLAGERGREIHGLGGHWPSPLFTAPRLLWLRNNRPEVLEKVRAVLSLSDWIAWRLGGGLQAEISQAGETLLFDLSHRSWASELIHSLGLPSEIFPPLVASGVRLGGLSTEAASHLGLHVGTPVAAGGADTQCGLLGAGAVDPGDVAVVAGTTMPLQMVTGEPVMDPEGRLWSGAHVIPGLFVLESNGLTAGYVLEWFSGLLYADYREPLLALLAEASSAAPGAEGIYSTLGAFVFDARTVTIPVGSLSLSHMVSPSSRSGRSCLSRSVLEGIAYSARANLEQIEEVTGRQASRILVAGGISRSELWTGMLSDVLGRPLAVAGVSEVSALGACLCAGVGAGLFRNLPEGARALVRTAREHSPGRESAEYQELYRGWREAYELNAPCESHLSGLMTVCLLKRAPREEIILSYEHRPRVLVTASMDERSLDDLASFCEIVYRPWREEKRVYDGGKELAEALGGCQVLVTEMDVVDFESIRSSPELKVIVVCRGNPVNVDLESATAYGIPVLWTPGRNADAVADLTVAFMLMLARRLPQACRFLRESGITAGDLSAMARAYLEFQGNELWRKTVGIIGLGEVGKRVARRLRPFGAEVLFYDPGVGREEGALCDAIKVSLEELMARSDFVTLHAPKNEATRGMIGRSAFSMMKEGAYFINTARASLVDHEALLEALQSGRLAGAALDVFPQEPPASDDPLVLMDQVITTPHIGGNTREIAAHQGSLVVEQLGKLVRKEKPDYLLNPEVMEYFSWEGCRRVLTPEEEDRLAAKERPSMTS